MAFANVHDMRHDWNPISDETITDPDGTVEIIITNRTVWVALCDDKIRITNDAYKELFEMSDMAFMTMKQCPNCLSTMKEIDPYGEIYDYGEE